jgi:hypothetical protein
MKKAIVLMGVAALMSAATVRADTPTFAVDGFYLYGHAGGFVQTPAGGEPGSTSSHRPKLSEMGINDVSLYDFNASADFDHNELFLGGQIGTFSGSHTLDSTLVSHGTTFPAGTHVSSDLTLDWYRLGYGRVFPIDAQAQWTITPSADVAILDFCYKLRGGGESTSRSYLKPTFQLGADLRWNPANGPFSIDAIVTATPPISGLPWIDEESIVASYKFINSKSVTAAGSIGVGFEQVRFEDSQTVSNHIKVDYGPLLLIGLRLEF